MEDWGRTPEGKADTKQDSKSCTFILLTNTKKTTNNNVLIEKIVRILGSETRGWEGRGVGVGDTKQESKSGAIAIEAAVTRADVRSPPPPAGSLIKEGRL